MAEQLPRTTRYTILACSRSRIHPRRVIAGSYESVADAVACANRVVRHSLELLHDKNPGASPDDLYRLYLLHGQLPLILGVPGIPFDHDRAVQWEIQLITRSGRSEVHAGLKLSPRRGYAMSQMNATGPAESQPKFTKEQWAALPLEERARLMGRTPERQAQVEQFLQQIGQALVNNLNANVLWLSTRNLRARR